MARSPRTLVQSMELLCAQSDAHRHVRYVMIGLVVLLGVCVPECRGKNESATIGGIFPLGVSGGLGWMAQRSVQLAVQYVSMHLDEFDLPCPFDARMGSSGPGSPDVGAFEALQQVQVCVWRIL